MTSRASTLAINALRRRAEQRVTRALPVNPYSSADLALLYHELQVHQVELEMQNEELSDANAELRSLNAEKQSLYQALLHEMAQPVQAMFLFLNALEKTGLTGEQVKLVAQLTRGVNRLVELSRDLSALGQDNVAVIEQPKRIKLQSLLKDTIDDHTPGATQRDRVLYGIPTCVNVETVPSLLRRIIDNIMANAIRRSNAPVLLIGVRELDDNTVRIEVWNCNAATATSSLPSLDDQPVERGTPKRSPVTGEGLELVVAYRLAEALGLNIEVRSIKESDGSGSESSLYAVTLPRRISSDMYFCK